MKFSLRVGNGPVNKLLNFGGNRDTGKTCLGRGMYCPSGIIHVTLDSVVLCWFCVVISFGLLVHACFCCIRFSFFSPMLCDFV